MILEHRRAAKASEEKLLEAQTRVSQHKKELELVDWYINVFEDGTDTKELVQ